MTMAHRMFMAAAGTGIVFDFTLSSSEDNWVLDTELVAAGWDEADKPITVNITINSSVQIGSTSTGTSGMNLGTLPADSAINLIIGSSGQINGKGGNGNSAQSTGDAGGTALYTRSPTTLTNNAEINGGGGGGGGGATWTNTGSPCSVTKTGTGGVGGAGYGNSSAVSGSSGSSSSGTCVISSGGPDASPCNTNSGTYGATGGTGGTGGGKGAVGNGGSNGSRQTGSGCGLYGSNGSVGGGGAAGSAVDGHSYIVYATAGTINGAQVN
jgi:hypothetical protein